MQRCAFFLSAIVKLSLDMRHCFEHGAVVGVVEASSVSVKKEEEENSFGPLEIRVLQQDLLIKRKYSRNVVINTQTSLLLREVSGHQYQVLGLLFELHFG